MNIPKSLTRRWEWLIPLALIAIAVAIVYNHASFMTLPRRGKLAPIVAPMLAVMVFVPMALDRFHAWKQSRKMSTQIKRSTTMPDGAWLVDAISRHRAWDTQEGGSLSFRELERISKKLGVSLPRIWIDERIVNWISGDSSRFATMACVIPVFPGWARFIHGVGPCFGMVAVPVGVVLIGSLVSVAPAHAKREFAIVLATLLAGSVFFAIGWFIAKQYAIVVARDQVVLTRFGREIACFNVDDAYLLIMPTYERNRLYKGDVDGVRWWMLFRGGKRFYCDDVVPPYSWMFAEALVAAVEYRSLPKAGICGGCGYSLRGLPPDAACPECGSRLLK